ncbi:MAG: hypothetical protein JST26_13485 [Bacteroidetes bacterium]|nr:hypothetical protein [Bacteroidota bacterium]
MKRSSPLLLLLILSVTGIRLSAQTKYTVPPEDFITFHKNISDAERMFKNDSALQAYARFDMAFSEYKGEVNPSHYMDAALAALRIKEEFKALNYLEKALTNGYEMDSAQREKVNFFSQNTKKEYAANLSKWEEAGRAAKNASYENSVYAMQENSKKFGTPAYKTAIEYCVSCLKNKACNKTAPEFTSKYKLVKEKMKADSTTAAELLGYIKQYGFPNYKLMDGKACAIARNVLLNYDADRKNERMNDMLYNALIKGQISPAFYAQLIDQRNLLNGQPLEFYEPQAGNEKTFKTDAAKINLNRKKLGLYPVQIINPVLLKGIDIKNMKALDKLYTKIYEY